MWNFVRRAVRRNYGQDKEYYRIIDELFGFVPHNIELYKLALIHKSASLVLADGRQINNERLEFLGDAVIEAVTSDYLYIEFPDRQEGFLTQLRSKIVSRQSLNTIARTIGLDPVLVATSEPACACAAEAFGCSACALDIPAAEALDAMRASGRPSEPVPAASMPGAGVAPDSPRDFARGGGAAPDSLAPKLEVMA